MISIQITINNKKHHTNYMSKCHLFNLVFSFFFSFSFFCVIARITQKFFLTVLWKLFLAVIGRQPCYVLNMCLIHEKHELGSLGYISEPLLILKCLFLHSFALLLYLICTELSSHALHINYFIYEHNTKIINYLIMYMLCGKMFASSKYVTPTLTQMKDQYSIPSTKSMFSQV